MSHSSTSTGPLTFFYAPPKAFLEGRLESLVGIPSNDTRFSTTTVATITVAAARGFEVTRGEIVEFNTTFAWPTVPLSAIGKRVHLGSRWARSRRTGRAFRQTTWRLT